MRCGHERSFQIMGLNKIAIHVSFFLFSTKCQAGPLLGVKCHALSLLTRLLLCFEKYGWLTFLNLSHNPTGRLLLQQGFFTETLKEQKIGEGYASYKTLPCSYTDFPLGFLGSHIWFVATLNSLQGILRNAPLIFTRISATAQAPRFPFCKWGHSLFPSSQLALQFLSYTA